MRGRERQAKPVKKKTEHGHKEHDDKDEGTEEEAGLAEEADEAEEVEEEVEEMVSPGQNEIERVTANDCVVFLHLSR